MHTWLGSWFGSHVNAGRHAVNAGAAESERASRGSSRRDGRHVPLLSTTLPDERTREDRAGG